MSDNTITNPGSGGDTFASDELTTINGAGAPAGLKVLRTKVQYGDDGDARDVSAAFPMPIVAPALTKGVQGSSGHSVQDLKDAGRTIVNCATAIAGVACVAAEALISMDTGRSGGATAGETSHAVTAGKRWRITALVLCLKATTAAVVSARVSLRYNGAGAATAVTPIIFTADISSGPATAETGNEVVVPIPDGIEFSGTAQWGLSQVASSVNGLLWVSAIGYEY
jgi:hypothetical protein